jgi:hypothetical protein
MTVVVHTRSDWTSRAGTGCAAMATSGIRGVVYHHPGSAGTLLGLTEAQVCSRLRGWQDDHMNPRSEGGRGYCDIAYQWAVADVAGQAHVYPCRTFDRRSAGQDNPNLAGSENDEWYAVLVVFGNDDGQVTPALVEGMRWCRAKALSRTPGATRVVPHSIFGDTECPGPVLRAALPLVAAEAPPIVILEVADMPDANDVWNREEELGTGARTELGHTAVRMGDLAEWAASNSHAASRKADALSGMVVKFGESQAVLAERVAAMEDALTLILATVTEIKAALPASPGN